MPKQNEVLDYFNTIGGDVLNAPKSIYDTFRHPYETNIQPLQDLAAQSREQFKTGHPVKGTISAIESGVPVLGPMVAGIGNDVSKGDYAKALGHATAMGGMAYAVPALSEEAETGIGSALTKKAAAVRTTEDAAKASKAATDNRISSLINELTAPKTAPEESTYKSLPRITNHPASIGGQQEILNMVDSYVPRQWNPQWLNKMGQDQIQFPEVPVKGIHPASKFGRQNILNMVDRHLSGTSMSPVKDFPEEPRPVITDEDRQQLADDLKNSLWGDNPPSIRPLPYNGLFKVPPTGEK